MTCVYEDHKLYDCPGIDSTTDSTTQSIDSQSMNNLQTTGKLNEETNTTTNTLIDKNSMVQLIETNKMSSWSDIINRNNQYINSPNQLNNNDIIESLNQITTTLSSLKLNDDIINSTKLDLSNSTDLNQLASNEQQTSSNQFGVRFNNNLNATNNSSKNSKLSTLKKIASSPTGYEDLYTKYQKRKKYKTTTTTTSSNSLQDESNNSGAETESIETSSYTTQSSNSTDKTYSSEHNVPNDQLLSTLSTLNDQLNNFNHHHSNHNSNHNSNHHSDYKKINDQSYQQFTAYQTNEDLVQPIKIGQMNKESNNLNLSTNTFNSQLDQSTESGFKPIFMQKVAHQQSNKPMNQFKFTNSQSVIKDQLDSIDSLVSSVNRERDNTNLASSTSNPVIVTNNNSSQNTIISELNQLNNQTLSNDLVKNNLAYQTRDQYRLMVKDVSDQKLKDFIKNNDLIDLSSTAISTNTPANSPQIVPQFLKERRSRIKNENLASANILVKPNNTTKGQLDFNWPKNGFQFPNNDKQQSLNYWPYLNTYQNGNFQNLNKQYNSYTLDNIIEDPAYKYDYVFGLSKVLPSINANFPPFLPDKNFMLKYPTLFSEYYSPTDLQFLNNFNNNNKFISPTTSPKKVSNNQEKSTTDASSLPSWLKSKFTLKSPISRNTNTNTNANSNKNNAHFSNTNNFLHSAASSSYNYLYELPPPSLLKQQHQHQTRTAQQSPMALPLISSTNGPNSQQQQFNNLLNSPHLNSQLNNMQMVNQPNNLLLNQLISTTTAPQTQQQSQQQNSNTRKTFFSQLSRLFSSASMARPVRVPYTTANLASAFSSLTQPFSKLQIDNLSNQLFSPFKGFLNATTSYIPVRKENPSNKNTNNNDEVDELDELEKQILNGISQYSLNPSSINQPSIGQQSTPNLGQNRNNLQNPLNFNAYNIHNHQMPIGQSLYGPIKRSSSITKPQQNYHLQMPSMSLKPEFYTTTTNNHYFQPQVRPLMNKPNEIMKQQNTNNPPQFSTTFPQSFLVDKHDLMDQFLLENGSDFFEDYGKRKKRRKRSVVAPINTIHYPLAPTPKFTFPFLAPYQFNAPLPMPSTFIPGFFASPPISHHPFNYSPTPVLPPIVPTHSFSKATKLLNSGESQSKSKVASSPITPTSSANLKLQQQQSTSIPSSFGTLSLASAASQLAYSLANISKNHKNTKIRKHLSKLTASSNFLPSISNLTNNGLVNQHQLNETIPATVTVWQKPPGKSTLTSWSFSSIPGKEFADFPFFNQYNTFRNLPSTAYFINDAKMAATNLHHPFNSQFNSLDLNLFPYHTLPTTNHPYPLTQQLHVEYRPANKITVNSAKTR